MRAPTEDEIATVRQEASSVSVRARGRMVALRVAYPAEVDADALRDAVADRLADTPLRGVSLLLVADAGPARVVGAVFE